MLRGRRPLVHSSRPPRGPPQQRVQAARCCGLRLHAGPPAPLTTARALPHLWAAIRPAPAAQAVRACGLAVLVMAVRTCGLAAAVMVEHALVVQVECDRPLRMREAAGLTARWVGGAWGEAEAEETPTASLAAQQVPRHKTLWRGCHSPLGCAKKWSTRRPRLLRGLHSSVRSRRRCLMRSVPCARAWVERHRARRWQSSDPT
mmetsp:Transcript_326/g.775  ORF Transcript_326/g.775 Transcript_326/m.775 type:complete len:203 (+) Transcript_326:173-781(+)